GRRLRIWCDQDPDEPDQPQLGSRTRAPEDWVLGQLALQARGGAVAGVEGGGRRQPQKLGADAHHLPAEVGLGHLPPDAAGKDRGAGHDVGVHLAVELDLDDGELRHPSLFTAMERAAVVGFAVFLVLICLFWTYGYIRRRSRKRY